MAEKKRKERAGGGESRINKTFNKHSKSKKSKNKTDTRNKRTGPRLPSALRTELDRLNPRTSSYSDDEVDSDVANDVYEYEEEVPQEESRKNRRFDPVDNYEYELPEDFEDENVSSDDDDDEDDFDVGGNQGNRMEDIDDGSDGVEEVDGERHLRMLQGIIGMSSDAFEGKKKKNNVVISEAHPESEYNPTRDVLEGGGRITVQDLLDPIQGKPGYSKLKKRVQHMDRKSTSIQAPLPKADRDKLERMAVYEHSKKDITKWEPLVKRNREAPTVFFGEDVDLGFSTVGAIASEFEPRTEFEKKIASLVYDDKVMEAHKADGSKLLELNKISEEEYIKNRNHIAKMRSLLFHHEMKRKRIKKIKSKTYHRLKNKDKLKAASVDMLLDPETAKEQARKQEFKRAEERMTLKHKNKSKWARRILERGMDVQDEGTRAAMAEQLNRHALLTRKMNTVKDSSSSSNDSSSDEDDEGSDQDRPSELLAKAKEKTLKVLEEEEDVPNSGVLSLPFMVRGMKKRKEVAIEEAKLALQEYEQLESTAGAVDSKLANPSGRRVFGVASNKALESNSNSKTDNNSVKTDNYYGNSDSEDDMVEGGTTNVIEKDADPNCVRKEAAGIHQDSVFKNFDDIVRDPGPKTTYEVAIFASDSWKKMKSGKGVETDVKRSQEVKHPVVHNQDLEEGEEGSDSDSEVQMVDGILSSGPKESYELPSQSELIRHAFAGDDVEEEFEKDKLEVLNEENPEPDKPVSLPGWGQWTHIQQKKGMPSWMLKEHEDAKCKREETLKNRKDAHLKHVIISEKLDKKAEKLQTKTLPYPFTSKEVFEQSMRMPIGTESNPETAVRALNRPEVVKKPGVIIKPIKFEEVHQHEKQADHKRGGQKRKSNKSKEAVSKKKK